MIGRLHADRDDGIFFMSRVARLAAPRADFRLSTDTGSGITHIDRMVQSGAAYRLSASSPLSVADVCRAFPRGLAVMKVVGHPNWLRWAAWDGSELLMCGPRPKHLSSSSGTAKKIWQTGIAILIDPEAARAYMDENGCLQ